MMRTARPLTLTRDQAIRLQAYLQTYRRYAFAALLPCIDRNSTLRILQAMQGKLIDAMDQKTMTFQLVLTVEELTTLRNITAELLLFYAKEPASEQRNAILADVAAL
ncbi:MAG: hypothetical protein ACRDHW_09295, partial [Ktedonobacteraceae bacterium]